MRLLFTILTVLTFGQLWSQSADDYVRKIEGLRNKGQLTTKTSVDKTPVGSMTAYYNNKKSLVLISTLTDAEASGTETLYFFRDGILTKAFIMASTFKSNDGWKEYYKKHKSVDKCYSCHGEPYCRVTAITFADSATFAATENKKQRKITQDEKTKMLTELQKTSEELKILAKELQ
ncbi:MAG TPA: hypothetical protein VFU05_05165 [Cyclobacteriaceae bacterium]|nr:hypothetical protein [Cyclobacteriaceae bacterium]